MKKENLTRKEVKAIRTVCGFTDDLRINLSSGSRDYIEKVILEHSFAFFDMDTALIVNGAFRDNSNKYYEQANRVVNRAIYQVIWGCPFHEENK